MRPVAKPLDSTPNSVTRSPPSRRCCWIGIGGELQHQNLTASAGAIAEAEALGGDGRRNAALVVANTEAMKAAIALADELDDHAILAMHDALMRASHPDMAGRWRTEQVWIGGGAFGPRGADFIAPHHGRVAGPSRPTGVCTAHRCAYAASDRDRRCAIRNDHPFTDGNGRTGRALVEAMLRNKRLTRQITVPVSAGCSPTPTPTSKHSAPTETDIRTDRRTAFIRGDFRRRQRPSPRRRPPVDPRRWDSRVAARRDSPFTASRISLSDNPVFDARTLQRELGITTGNAADTSTPLSAPE